MNVEHELLLRVCPVHFLSVPSAKYGITGLLALPHRVRHHWGIGAYLAQTRPDKVHSHYILARLALLSLFTRSVNRVRSHSLKYIKTMQRHCQQLIFLSLGRVSPLAPDEDGQTDPFPSQDSLPTFPSAALILE